MNKRDLEAVLEEVRNLRSNRKGCNYCLKTNPEYAGYSDIWHDNKLSIGYGNYIEINFCPMCGRYLRGANTPHHILPGEGRKYTERWRKRRR